jgi:hypothetical protein
MKTTVDETKRRTTMKKDNDKKDLFMEFARMHMGKVLHEILELLTADRHENLPHLSIRAASDMHAAVLFGVLRHICAPEWLAYEDEGPELLEEYMEFSATLSKDHGALVKKLRAWKPQAAPEQERSTEPSLASLN